jgi:hypothetical protein
MSPGGLRLARRVNIPFGATGTCEQIDLDEGRGVGKARNEFKLAMNLEWVGGSKKTANWPSCKSRRAFFLHQVLVMPRLPDLDRQLTTQCKPPAQVVTEKRPQHFADDLGRTPSAKLP